MQEGMDNKSRTCKMPSNSEVTSYSYEKSVLFESSDDNIDNNIDKDIEGQNIKKLQVSFKS